MTDGFVVAVGREALWTAFLVGGPVLLLALLVGLVVSVLQAATQINEQTLSFFPKLLAIALGLLLFGPFMIHTMVAFTTRLLTQVASVAR